jgi:hypothetical protein
MSNKETKKHDYWLRVRRSRKTGRNVRSISLDSETDDILSQVDNVSKFVCDAAKEKWHRKRAGKPYLMIEEEEFWGQVHTFFVQHFLLEDKKWFPETLTPELSAEIFDQAEEGLKWQLEQGLETKQIEDVRAAQRLIRKAREDQEIWRELYQKFRVYWEWYKHAPAKRGLLIE